MRKVLSFVLVLSLVLGSFSFAFAGAGDLNDIQGKDCEDAVNVLSELEVVTGYPDGTYKPENIVTRAEMAVIIIKAMGLEGFAAGSKSTFKDMAGYDWAQSYVGYAQSRGIIVGYPDGTFKPAQTVSYNEAAKMLVAAVGYPLSVLQGAWPANYVNKAQDLGILDGINASAAGANRGDIAVMTYQTLDVPMVRVDNDNRIIMLEGKWNNVAGAYDAVTMMTKLDVQDYDPPGAGLVAGDKFVLDDSMAKDAITNVRPYIGAYVTAYANDDNEILAIKEVKSTFLTGEFTTLFAAGAVTDDDVFEVDDVEYTVDLPAAPFAFTEITNGQVPGVSPGYPTAINVEYTLAVDLSGKRIKDVYSVALWNPSDDFLFETDMVDDDNINGNDFVLDDDDAIDTDSFGLFGVKSLSDIKKDNVVYVYNAGGEVQRIEVGTTVVKGEITKIKSDLSAITVGGKSYEFSTVYTGTPTVGSLDLGDEVELYLDYAGDVYDIEMVSGSADNYAMVLFTEDQGVTLATSQPQVKLFLADGTTKTFKVEAGYSDPDGDDALLLPELIANGVWTALAPAGPAAAPLMVEYGLDKDGEIDYINNLYDVATDWVDTLAVTHELTEKGYYNGSAFESDALIFTYDAASGTGPDDEDCYGTTTKEKAAKKTFAARYLLDTGKITAMWTVGLGTGDDDIFGVVVSRAKTSESTTDYQLTTLAGGKEVKYDVTKAVYDMFAAPGATRDYNTLYKFGLNTSNAISALTAIPGDADADTNAILNVGAVATAYTGGILTAGGTDYTIDSAAVAYKVNSDGDFEACTVSRANMVDPAKTVRLYDTDGDLVADVVLIN